MAELDIGFGKSARRAYGLEDIAIIPSRRTRDPADVDISWQIDAYRFDIPVIAASTDSVTSPATALSIAELGGIGILDLEGLWTRWENPADDLAELSLLPAESALARLRELYARPVQPELVGKRIAEISAAGFYAAGRVRPTSAVELAPYAIAAEIDLLVISGTIVSAEHVSTTRDPLNLKTFIRYMQTPVIVGGCMSYRAALHLMRTGAAGVIVGTGSGFVGTTPQVLGLDVPRATAIADARAARMRHLDETGVYCHVIADGAMRTSGDIARAIVCGADAVIVGSALAAATDSPSPGWHWDLSTVNPTLPRGRITEVPQLGTLAEILHGPALNPEGTTNMMGALRASLAKCGYTDLKDFQRAELAIVSP